MSAPAAPIPITGRAERATGGAARVTPMASTMPLAAEHFAAGILYLVTGAVALVWVAPEVAHGAFASPHVAGITHLFTLGWLTTTIFGVLSHFMPGAMETPVRSVRWGHAGFWTFAPGAGVFATGVATVSTGLRHAGIALLTIGILLEVSRAVASLLRTPRRDVTWIAVLTALGFLLSTLVLGAVLLHNLQTGFIARARLTVLATHFHVALVGWALIMIVGVSHRLLPMFLLAPGANMRYTPRALALLAGGLPVLATGFITRSSPVTWAGVVLLECGVGHFLWQAYTVFRARVRKKIDVGMWFATTALGFLTVDMVLGPVVLLSGTTSGRIATMYVAVGLLGVIVLYVSGFFYKIAATIAWNARFGRRAGREQVPAVADLYSAQLARVQLAIMAGGVAVLALGIALAAPVVARVGALSFLGGVAVFVTQIRRVAFGRVPSAKPSAQPAVVSLPAR
ncbi:MAG TPA: hypothetical protein VFK13_06740 [Gemmatimonadaceae bacterium]|nr:hypothetical protein [Gemmatimonadaceae bacterium]